MACSLRWHSSSGLPPTTDIARFLRWFGALPIRTTATSENCGQQGVVLNRGRSRVLRFQSVVGSGVIAPQRTSSAHFHRPWRAPRSQRTEEVIPSSGCRTGCGSAPVISPPRRSCGSASGKAAGRWDIGILCFRGQLGSEALARALGARPVREKTALRVLRGGCPGGRPRGSPR